MDYLENDDMQPPTYCYTEAAVIKLNGLIVASKKDTVAAHYLVLYYEHEGPMQIAITTVEDRDKAFERLAGRLKGWSELKGVDA